MAFDKTDKSNLESLAQSMGRAKPGNVNMPAGKPDEEEIQYSVMDLMAGICSSALFVNGSNKNKDNVKTFLSDSKKSYLFSIDKHLTVIESYLKDSNISTSLSSISQSLTDILSSKKPITIELTPSSQEVLMGTVSNPTIIETQKVSDNNESRNASPITGKADMIVLLKADQSSGKEAKEILTLIRDIFASNNKTEQNGDKFNLSYLETSMEAATTSLTDIIGKMYSNLHKLGTELKKYKDEHQYTDQTILASVQEVIDIIKAINEVNRFTAELKPINLSAVQSLIQITKPGGDISVIIDNLNTLSAEVISDEAQENIEALDNFFSAISSIGDISMFKRIRMLLGLKFIRAFMLKDIRGLVDDINTEFKDIDVEGIDAEGYIIKRKPVKLIGLSNISELFRFITNLADQPLKNIGKLKVNLNFIKKHLLTNITQFITDLNEGFKTLDKDKTMIISSFTGFFDTLFKSLGGDRETINRMRHNARVLTRIFITDKESIKTLIESLGEIQQDGLDKQIGTLNLNVQSLMALLNTMTDTNEDELKDLYHKIELALDDFKLIKKLITAINKFDVKEDNNLKIIHDFYIKGLFDINDAIINGMSNADAKNVDKYIESSVNEVVLLQSFVNAVKNLSTFISTLTDEDKKAFDEIESLLLDLDAITLHNITPEEIAKKLSISKESAEGVKRFDQFVNQLIVTAQSLDIISTLGPAISKGINVINTMIHKLVDTTKDIDEKKVASISKLFESVNKLIIMCAFTLLIGAFAASVLNIKSIVEFGAGMMLMMTGVSLIIKQLGKMDEKQLKQASKTMLGISFLLMTGAGVLIFVSKYANTIDWNALGLFTAGLIAFISITMLSLTLIFKLFKIDKIAADLTSFGLLIGIAALTLIIAAKTAAEVQWPLLFAFAGSIGLLILLTSIALSLMHTPIAVMAFSGAASLGLLIISCAAAIGLGAFIVKTVPIPMVLAFGSLLGAFIDSILYTLSDRLIDINMSIKTATGLGILILMSTLALTIGPMLMQHIDKNFAVASAKVLAFGVLLGAFVASITWAYNTSAQGVDGAIQTAKHLATLVTVSALTLILGTLLVQAIDDNYWYASLKILAFATLLGAFIVAISWAYGKASDGVDGNITTAKQLAILVAVSAATLILGVLLITGIDGNYWSGLGKVTVFGIVLAAFVAGITWAYSSSADDINESIKPAIALSIVIATTALALSLPFLIFKKNNVDILEVAAFAIIMSGTVWVFSKMLQNINKSFRKNDEAIRALLILSGISAVIFALSFVFQRLAAIAAEIDGFGGFAKLLGVTGLMIIAVYSFIYLLKQLGKVDLDKIAVGLGALVGITLVLFGLSIVFQRINDIANEMGDIKEGFTKIGGILVLMIVTVGLIGVLAKFLGKIKLGEMIKGIAIIAVAGLILFGLAYIFKFIADNLLQYDNIVGQMWAVTMSMLGIMAVFIIGIGLIGLLGSIAWPFLLIGAGVMVVAGIMLFAMGELFAHIMELDAKFDFANSNKMKTIIKGMFDTIQYVMDRIQSLDISGGKKGFLGKLGGMVKGAVKSGVLLGVLGMINQIAHTLANLAITIKLFGSDPTKTMEDSKIMISSLIGIFNDKDLQANIESISVNSKQFTKATKAISILGKAISAIGKSVHQIASLSIPTAFDNEGNPIAFRPMDEEDFQKASRNISLIITTVGGAIMGLFTGKDAQGNDMNLTISQRAVVKEMMESSGFLNLGTKFGKIINSTSRIGPMINSIAEGVQSYASLKVPTQWDKEGKPINWRPMKDEDFQAAARNIALIVTSVGGAIMGLFTGKDAQGNDMRLSETQLEVVKEMMSTAGGIGALFTGETKFSKIIKATSGLGEVISNIATGVLGYASMQVPDKWDDHGMPIHFVDVDKNKVFPEAVKNINEIITLIGESLLTTASQHPELFKEPLIGDAPIAIAVKASAQMGEVVAGLAKGIQAYANLRIPDKWDDKGNPIHWIEVADKNAYFGEAGTNISKIVTIIGETMFNLANSDKAGFFDIGRESPITRITNALAKSGDIIASIANNISSYATGDFPILSWVAGRLTIIGRTHIGPNEWEKAKENIKQALITIGSAFIEALEDDDLEDLLTGKQSEKLAKNVETIMTTITKMANSINGLVKIDLKAESLDNVVQTIGRYLGIIKVTHKYATKYDYDDVEDSLDGYSKFISKWVEICKDVLAQDSEKGFNILKTSIENVTAAVAKIDNTDALAEHVKSIKEYVETIDGIDISKVESLTNLIDAVNTLGTNMKNLDEFTNVIANKLSVALDHLAMKLDEAKKTIKDADALHEKREKLIKGSVNTIRELMGQEMVVKIEQEESAAGGGGDFTPTDADRGGGGEAAISAEGGESTSITQNNVSQGSGGSGSNNSGSQGDNSALAAAIGREIRKILSERNIGNN